ncbi:Putative biotin/lipoyl attachment, biotin-binding, Carboxyltransferase domain, subdomain A and B [Septoria linicola]|uniref:Biotin/lipoyl attachment, biotin-binding, Carboxyltransferase domain, subdomain A and B n=1 Tax=Septoria linicola TaxID=215465 RepID=A0A9Q9EGB2_9PEZI|nr:Putative biotin/lipoyl attachment, biotin-binding, Carboxyltransferase domain, subdomain A and B [Septoria linicola]
MEKLKKLLVANRGEIAVRIIKTAKQLGIETVSIYTSADAASLHVSGADEAVLLPSLQSYTDGDHIIEVAKAKGCDAIIPGYGFLSENAAFAKDVTDAGLAWVGPSEDAIKAFGIKHTARDLAKQSGVPIVPGTEGLVETEDDAVEQSSKLGFPVMLKITAGGGGSGLIICQDAEQVKDGFKKAQSRGQALFKDSGVFIERFYPEAHHIEVQVFGNGLGQAVHFGERECSIQRRHQKVIEECPSPFVESRSGLREQICSAAVKLAESVKYGSAGTVEFLVDDKSAEFYFLEMNTRLQVEHPITEACYDVDLVELMLKQADAQLLGAGGLPAEYLGSLQRSRPFGAAIEARVYAENVLRDYAPSPGLLTQVHWAELQNARIDTWVRTGLRISPNYDPLIAKVINHAKTREAARKGLAMLLGRSLVQGPPNNLDFLTSIMEDGTFKSGRTITSYLQSFVYEPSVIDVVSSGAYTLIQDLDGRPAIGKGIPRSGAMDPIALAAANLLVGNQRGQEGLEITLQGPELKFHGPAAIALTGAPIDVELDGDSIPMWTRKHIKPGQLLRIGRTTGGGCRSYLAVYGGFSNVADYFGSKSTSPIVAIGGYQGRQLAPGDQLNLAKDIPSTLHTHPSIPEALRPQYSSPWTINALPGPHEEGYLTEEDIEMLYSTEWKVSHNASRSAIRLIGPVPKWARADGGEGGSHPSNLVEYGYSCGSLNWTGDEGCIFSLDCPNFGGFASSATAIRADYWKLGQLKAGDTLRYQRVSLKEALLLRQNVADYLDDISEAVQSSDFGKVRPLNTSFKPSGDYSKAVLSQSDETSDRPQIRYRQAGDDYILVEYGNEQFNLNYRCRVTALEKAVNSDTAPTWLKQSLTTTVGCCTSLTICYNGATMDRQKLLEHLQELEEQIGDLSKTKVPCRRFKLPLSFESKEQTDATKRYMETQRPHAPYLPDNLGFVAKNNAFTADQLKHNMLNGELMAVVVGFFCGNTVSLPVDPRQRMSSPKANPSRVFTPEGTFGWGGSCASIYPVDSPGGYQMLGRTIPCFDYYGFKQGFTPERPWLFQDFDILTFYQVNEDELNQKLELFRSGQYEFEWESAEFDMEQHNKLLAETSDEVVEIRAAQRKVQAEMIEAENASLAKWRADKAKNKPDESTIDMLLQDPSITAIEAPVDANVWKIEVKEKDVVKPNQVIAILEAMKLEINVNAPESVGKGTAVIEKLLIEPGETIRAGGRIALIRNT